MKTDATHWKYLNDFAETFVPGWADMGLFIVDALMLAWQRERNALWEMYLQAEELGWGRVA